MKHGIYFIQNPVTKSIKIGKWSGKSHKGRLAELQVGNEERLDVLATQEAESSIEAYNLEVEMHIKFTAYRKNGEWFAHSQALENHIAKLIGREPVNINQYDSRVSVLEDSITFWREQAEAVKEEKDRLAKELDDVRHGLSCLDAVHCSKCRTRLSRHQWYVEWKQYNSHLVSQRELMAALHN